jgi:hypothetical protein
MASHPETPTIVKRSWFATNRLFAIWTAAFLGIMAWNWGVWPKASITFGPFWFVRSEGLEALTAIGIVILLSMLFAFPARPGVFTAILSAAGFGLWCAAGMIGQETIAIPVVVSPQTAYSDGFEVVIVELAEDGTPASARSVPLAEAEQAARDERCTLLMPDDETAVAQMLEQVEDRKGDFSVHVSVERLSTDKQKIRTSFHDSMRTYSYEYEIAGGTVTPMQSGYRDLRRSSAVRYRDK